MAKSKARFLSELLGDTGLVKKSKSALAGADEILDLDTLPTIPNSKLQNSSISIAGHSTALGSSVSLNTGDISEHTNYPYFTNARARGAVSVSGDLAYNSSTGVISFTERTDAEVRGLVSAGGSLSYNSSTGVFSYTTPTTIASLSNHDTADLAEGTNLYFTNARADARIAAASTSDLSEGTNLYFTNARADARIAAASTSDLSEGTNLYYTNARADARIAAATTDDLSEGSSNLYYTDARADARVALIVDSAPGTLNTLNELAAALGDDANFSTTVTNSIATKLPLAGGTMTGHTLHGDNIFSKYGTGNDFEIYFNGTHGVIRTASSSVTGNIYIQDDNNIVLGSIGGETYLNAAKDGAVTLYHNNAAKLDTTTTGIDVTGDLTIATTSNAPAVTVTSSNPDTWGAAVIVGATTANETLVDSNDRPMVIIDGQYPVLNLNHTVTTNSNHGPTIQFTVDGYNSNRQAIIGTDGQAQRIDFGFSGGTAGTNSDKNPHRGIAGYNGLTAMRLFQNGLLVGSTGVYPNEIASISNALDVRGSVLISGTTSSSNIRATADGSLNTYEGVVKTVNTNSAQWGHIILGGSATNNAINNTYMLGRGGAVADRHMSFHIPNAAQYSDTTQPKFLFASSGADTLMTITASTGAVYIKGSVSSGAITSSEGIFGSTSGSNQGIQIKSGTGTNDYGRIRYYEGATTQRNTIHFFGRTWQSGSLAGHSTGAINIDGDYGVTFGNWTALDAYIDGDGIHTHTNRNYYVGSTIVIDSSRNLTNIGTISSGAITSSSDITANGYLQAYSYLYTRSDLRVLNAAGTGWTTWATRSNGNYNLSVGTISSGAITSSGPITVNNVNDTYNFKAIAGDTDSWFGVYDDANNSANIIVTRSDGATSFLHLGHSGATTINGTLSSGAITASGDITAASGTLTVKPTSGGGGQIGLGDWSNTNPIGISEGLWNTVSSDNDYITIYSRNSFNIRGYAGGTTYWLNLTGSVFNLVASQPIQLGGTTVIDSSRNLTNIGTISSGAITSSGIGNFGGAVIATSSSAGWGTGSYPYVGRTASPSLIMFHNVHLPFRTDNARSGASGRAGVRMAIDTAGSNWWDAGLIGDSYEIYRNASSTVFLSIDSNGAVNIGNLLDVTTLRVRGDNSTGYSPSALTGGINLWGSGTTSQIMFKPTASGSLGNHGYCTDSYNTYFVMDTSNRGWVFRNASTSTNIASISNNGDASFGTKLRSSYSLFVNEGSTVWTYEDSSTRAKVYVSDTYPVVTLNAETNTNGNHGATIQFIGSGHDSRKQWVIGSGNTIANLDFGWAHTSNGNPHYGIAGLTQGLGGATLLRLSESGVGLGGNWGYYGTLETPAFPVHILGNLGATGNITAYYSDERLKTRTGTLANALEKVNSLEGFTYVENDLAKELGYKNDQQQVGVSAQQVKMILPEAVSLAPIDAMVDEETGERKSKSGKDYLTVDYSRLVPLLVEAIKEQSAQINAQQEQINELTALVNALMEK